MNDSHIDYKFGFGGNYGINEDRMDKTALGWDYYEAPEGHSSQKGKKAVWGNN